MVSDQAKVSPTQSGTCPFCKKFDLIEGVGKLDQSCGQYLPTKTFSCGGPYGGCGYKRFEAPPPGTQPMSRFSTDDKPQTFGDKGEW